MKSHGQLQMVKGEKSNLLICKIRDDFANLYKSLIEKIYWEKYSLPRIGCHLTILDSYYHNKADINWARAQELVGNKIWFEYNPEEIIRGGGLKSFDNFYFVVDSPDSLEVRRKVLGKNFDPNRKPNFHITICNNKGKENGKWPSYWPSCIEVKSFDKASAKADKFSKTFVDNKRKPVILKEDKGDRERLLKAFCENL